LRESEIVVELIVLEPDLFFSSRIESISAKLGIEIRILTSLQDLRAALSVESPKVLVVNLDALAAELETLGKLTDEKSFKIVGYYSHVNTKLDEEARKIGADLVLPRRTFVTKMQDVLSGLMSG
jgi:hypothetical protein